MPGIPAGREARPVADSARNYERRRPDETLLYRIIEQYYPVLSALMAEQGRELPGLPAARVRGLSPRIKAHGILPLQARMPCPDGHGGGPSRAHPLLSASPLPFHQRKHPS